MNGADTDPVTRLTSAAQALFQMPISALTMVSPDGSVVRAGQGIGNTRVRVDSPLSFTHHAAELGPGGLLVVEDALADPRFKDHPLVQGPAALRFVVGAVVSTPDGTPVGMLTVADRRTHPRPSERDCQALLALAETAGSILSFEASAQAQKEKLALLELAGSMSGVGYWRYDPIVDRVSWSQEVYRIHGIEPDGFDLTLESIFSMYHPDDRAILGAEAERVQQHGGGYRLNLRIIRADGQVRTIIAQADSLPHPSGQGYSLFGVVQDVTDVETALIETRRSESRYRLLAENSADVITRIARDGSSRYASPSITALLGCTPEEMTGQIADYVHPDDLADVLQVIGDVLDAGGVRSLQHRLIKRNGDTVWVDSRFQTVACDGPPRDVVVAVRDISDRKRLEDQLQAALEETRISEERYRLIAERSSDVIVTYGFDSIVTYASPALGRITGISPEEMVGTSINRLVHPDDIAEVNEKLLRFVSEHPDQELTSLSYRAFDKTGAIRHYETRTQVVRDAKGRCVEIQDVARDVTEQYRLEVELRQALERAEQAAQAKSEFLANMSHELRTPLTSIIGFAALLRDSQSLAEIERRHVERIATGSEALLAVINDILDYSKLEAGKLDMDARPFDPATLALSSAELMESQRSVRGLDLVLEIDEDLPKVLLGDEGRVRQVVLNFLSNAVKFTPSGTVRLHMGGHAREGGWHLRVAVTDTGIGIEPEKLDGLFDRFTQADMSVTRTYGGTGLGLSISRRIIEAMGGQIGAESQAGEGSTFWFEVELPLAESMEPPKPEISTLPKLSARVLVADDAPANRDLIRTVLTHMGLDVETVCDGAEAIEALAVSAFDLVLMDVHMPVMDGLTATRTIRDLEDGQCRVPIIALTASVQADQVRACLAAGMDAHLGKPIDFGELAQTITYWLNVAVGQGDKLRCAQG